MVELLQNGIKIGQITPHSRFYVYGGARTTQYDQSYNEEVDEGFRYVLNSLTELGINPDMIDARQSDADKGLTFELDNITGVVNVIYDDDFDEIM